MVLENDKLKEKKKWFSTLERPSLFWNKETLKVTSNEYRFYLIET